MQVQVELVHFARKGLSPAQLIRCINLMASISSSGGLPPQVHIICVRVMLGLTGAMLCGCRRLCLCERACVCVRVCVCVRK